MRLTAHAAPMWTAIQISTGFLESLLAGYPQRDFQVRFWDDSIWGSNPEPRFTLVLKHPGALREMFLAPSELTLAEAYICDDFDIEGDIQAAFHLADYLLDQGTRTLPHNLRLASLLHRLPAKRPTRPDRQQAR